MGKNKKFKSFAEETAEELSAMKATLLKTQEQQGEIFLQFCAVDRRSEEFGKKCLKQLSDSANCNLGEFSKALAAHEKQILEKLHQYHNREHAQQESLRAIGTKLEEIGSNNSSLSSQVNWMGSKTSNKFYDLERKVKSLEKALEEEKETALSVQMKLEERLNELEQLVMMGRAKPKKSKKSVVFNPEDGDPVVWGDKEQAEAEEVLRFDEVANQEPKKSIFDGVTLKQLNPDGSFAEVRTISGEAPIADFISADNVVIPPPGSQNPIDDPITTELKALGQFCKDKKKKGDAERAKVLPLPEDVG